MAVQIQIRRGTDSEWTSANPVLADGEMGIATDLGQFKIGNGTSNWNTLPYQTLPASTMSKSVYTGKGVIASGSASGAPIAVAAGANDSVLVADSAQNAGVKWATTLSGLTLTSPTINTGNFSAPAITGAATIGTGASVTTPVITNPTVTTGSFTTPTITNGYLVSPREKWNIVAAAPSATTNIDLNTASNWYYTSDTTVNWTFNFRGDGSTALNSLLATGESVTTVIAVKSGATAYFSDTVTVDGNAITESWQGEAVPTVGNVNGMDLYMFTILKTGNNTYKVFGSQTQYS